MMNGRLQDLLKDRTAEFGALADSLGKEIDTIVDSLPDSLSDFEPECATVEALDNVFTSLNEATQLLHALWGPHWANTNGDVRSE